MYWIGVLVATKNILVLQYDKGATPDMVEDVVRQMTRDLQMPVIGVIGAQATLVPVSVAAYDELLARILDDD